MWAESLKPFSAEIAFYGDSRVAGTDWGEAFPEEEVVNLGVGGDIIEGTIQRLPLLDALEIKHCFLAIGGNNCLSSKFNESAFERNYRLLIDKLLERNIKVYINTIAGVTTANSNFQDDFINEANTKLSKANRIIREISSDYNLPLIDMALFMNDENGILKAEYSTDGVHFTDAGYSLWFDKIQDYIDLI